MTSIKRHVVAALALVGALVALVSFASSASAYTGTGGGANTGGVSVGTNSPSAGGALLVSGNECEPNSMVSISLDGTQNLGRANTDGSGSYSTTVRIPSGISGSHQIRISGAFCAAVAGIEVQSAAVTSGGGSAGGSGGSGGLASTGVAVVGIGAVGVVLLVGGGLMLLAGKRRKVSA